MKRKVFEIVLVIAGLIIGSLATIHGKVIPTKISVISNQDTKILIKSGGQKVREIEINDLDILPTVKMYANVVE